MYDGIEVDMLSLGDADSILVSRWNGFEVRRVLIDGGYKKDAATVRRFLHELNVSYIDDLVCSHIHDDHAGGLVDLASDRSLTFGRAWLHIPGDYISVTNLQKALAVIPAKRFASKLSKSLETTHDLIGALEARRIPICEPVPGQLIGGFLTICGPSREYYTTLVCQFADPAKLAALGQSADLHEVLETIDLSALLKSAGGTPVQDTLLDDPDPGPINNSSIIVGTEVRGGKYLFTADAGPQALWRAADEFDLSNLYWMQLPHHGSRRNITSELIDLFTPTVAYVSAEGNSKHPRRAVVNAFKRRGTRVFGTHYPTPNHKRHSNGSVPPRSGYSPIPGLWE